MARHELAGDRLRYEVVARAGRAFMSRSNRRPTVARCRLSRCRSRRHYRGHYNAGARAASLAEQLSKRFPRAKIRASQRELIVDGPFETHDAIARLLSGERVRPPSNSGEQRYSLNLENKPVGGVIRALAKQVGKEVVFDVSQEGRSRERDLGELLRKSRWSNCSRRC